MQSGRKTQEGIVTDNKQKLYLRLYHPSPVVLKERGLRRATTLHLFQQHVEKQEGHKNENKK